jgi:hypothetical protein
MDAFQRQKSLWPVAASPLSVAGQFLWASKCLMLWLHHEEGTNHQGDDRNHDYDCEHVHLSNPLQGVERCTQLYMDVLAGFTDAAAMCFRVRRVAACLMTNID